MQVNSSSSLNVKRHRSYADLALLFVALLWGTTYSISKYALDV